MVARQVLRVSTREATSNVVRPETEPAVTAPDIPVPELVRELRAALVATLVAYLGGVRETRAVRQWADGQRTIQNSDQERRLRLAYQITAVITARDSAAVAAAWFQGLNPDLADQSPARVLREGDLDEVGPQVLAAARAFAASA